VDRDDQRTRTPARGISIIDVPHDDAADSDEHGTQDYLPLEDSFSALFNVVGNLSTVSGNSGPQQRAEITLGAGREPDDKRSSPLLKQVPFQRETSGRKWRTRRVRRLRAGLRLAL